MYSVRKGLKRHRKALNRKALAFFREMRYNTINRTRVLFYAVYKEFRDSECPDLPEAKKKPGRTAGKPKRTGRGREDI